MHEETQEDERTLVGKAEASDVARGGCEEAVSSSLKGVRATAQPDPEEEGAPTEGARVSWSASERGAAPQEADASALATEGPEEAALPNPRQEIERHRESRAAMAALQGERAAESVAEALEAEAASRSLDALQKAAHPDPRKELQGGGRLANAVVQVGSASEVVDVAPEAEAAAEGGSAGELVAALPAPEAARHSPERDDSSSAVAAVGVLRTLTTKENREFVDGQHSRGQLSAPLVATGIVASILTASTATADKEARFSFAPEARQCPAMERGSPEAARSDSEEGEGEWEVVE